VPLEAWKVDPKVGNVRNIGPELCEPWAHEPQPLPFSGNCWGMSVYSLVKGSRKSAILDTSYKITAGLIMLTHKRVL